MNASAFRHLYDYHFAENRKIWDRYVTSLSFEQFTQNVSYSHGSVRNQVIHLLGTEDLWFCEVQNIEPMQPFPPAEFDDRENIRAAWDASELRMQAYLSKLSDEMLFSKPITFEEDNNLFFWQVLIHVVNHATDHRAQLLRVLYDLGVKTGSQDYIFYVYDHPVNA